MKTAKELREERNKLLPELQRLRDLNNNAEHDWSAEDEEAWTRANGDYDRLSADIERAERGERVDAIERDLDTRRSEQRAGREDIQPTRAPGNPEGTQRTAAEVEEDRALAFQTWATYRRGRPSEQGIAACRRVGLNPQDEDLSIRLLQGERLRSLASAVRGRDANVIEERALSAVSGTAGAFTIAPGFVRSIEVNMLAWGGMLQVASIMRTATGEDMPWPTADDTSAEGEIINENTAASEDEPTFGAKIFKAYLYSSKMVKVPTRLLRDAAFDMPGELGRWLGTRLGRIGNSHFTTGTGASQPLGIVTGATLGVTADASDAITADELLELEHSVDPAYRLNASWMMHDSVLLHLRKLKDGEGRYLWQSGLVAGAPDRLLGRPLTINQSMASTIESGAKTVIFGDLSAYKIRQVNTMRLRRLDERYAEYDQVAFLAWLEQDGGLLDAGTAPVKYIQQT